MKRGWGATVWSGVLSLISPGLGHVHARAWRLGVGLFGVWLAIGIACRALMTAQPTPALVLVLYGILVVGVMFCLWAALDAGRRTRHGGGGARPVWWQSTWCAAIVAAVTSVGISRTGAMPAHWRSFDIPSGSDIPTLLVGDYLIADTSPLHGMPARGEMVLFRMPRKGGSIWVKRLIGLPGDRVQMKAGRLYLNDAEVARVALGAFTGADFRGAFHARRYRETLPGGRSYDIIKEYDAGGLNDTPTFVVPAGQFFVLGDNRDNSADSRLSAQIGTIPFTDMIGRPAVIGWSSDHRRILSVVR